MRNVYRGALNGDAVVRELRWRAPVQREQRNRSATQLGAPSARSRRITGTQAALVGIVAGGAALRIWLMHTWGPAFLGYPDTARYVIAAHLGGPGVFNTPYEPAGYPMFLSSLHSLDGRLGFVIGLQHLMGLATAVLLYLAAARFTRRRWIALLPAAVVAFSGSELYLEHAPLSETLYTFLVACAIWCAARSHDAEGRREAYWLAAAGLLVGATGSVRAVGVVLAPVLVIWAAATRRGFRPRLRAGAIVAAGCAVTLGGYLAYQHSVTGTWGITRDSGEMVYARAAIFADCRDFTPPAGTKALCQPPGAPRQLAEAYMFAPNFSPALKAFGWPPDPALGQPYRWPAASKLESFGFAAISHQPWDYLSTTAQGLVKYVVPSFGTPTMLEWNQDTLVRQLRNPHVQAFGAEAVDAYYPREHATRHSMTALDDYARAAKVEGPVTAVLLVLLLAGVALGRERRRAGAGLLGLSTAMMMLAPVALLYYGVRYATPSYGPLAAAAAIGLDEVVDRGRSAWNSSRRTAAAPSTEPSQGSMTSP